MVNPSHQHPNQSKLVNGEYSCLPSEFYRKSGSNEILITKDVLHLIVFGKQKQ